jgi:hypothetical protein
VTAVVTVETLLLALLVLLVGGLLRSHAEILRRLDELQPAGSATAAPARASATAHDVAGVSLAGDAVHLGVTRPGSATLLAFLTSGCSTCQTFWDAFADPRSRLPAGVRLVVVTKDPSHESPVRLEELAPPGIRVVMSSAAWTDYDVPASPYFVHVDAGGELAGEGTAQRFDQVLSLLADAVLDAASASGRRGSAERALRAEHELAAAGIGPGHPSLYLPPESDAPRAG